MRDERVQRSGLLENHGGLLRKHGGLLRKRRGLLCDGLAQRLQPDLLNARLLPLSPAAGVTPARCATPLRHAFECGRSRRRHNSLIHVNYK